MGRKTRAFIFILINIIISVSATLTVLWLWKRAHPYPDLSMLGLSIDKTNEADQQRSMGNQNSVIESELSGLNQDINIQIRTIVGAGNLSVEYVEIINQGENPTNLTAWKLVDEEGHEFVFPALILHNGGAIKVHSKAGTNTVITLFWQSETPIWQSGETAYLVSAGGETMASYLIP